MLKRIRQQVVRPWIRRPKGAALFVALFAALATDEPALGVKCVSVRASALGAEDRDLAFGRHLVDVAVVDIAEIQVTLCVECGTFEQASPRRDAYAGAACEQARRQWRAGQARLVVAAQGRRE